MHSHLPSTCPTSSDALAAAHAVVGARGSAILSHHAASVQAHRQAVGHTQNACGHCGATAYKSRMARDDLGAMRPSGQYQCVRCQRVFTDIGQWRAGSAAKLIGH